MSFPFLVSGIDEPEEARANALGALITFALLFGVCVYLIHKNKNSDGREYDAAPEDYNRLNVDLKKVYGEQKVYGSVATDSIPYHVVPANDMRYDLSL
ncbi:hypothetical protein ACHAXA_003006 [Cyclostephanos tholiformis]|uniref:Uncharacterized protein n=1 Tax=Cyclostephanos tholiformis TaxID=382380 RepID=A0ABD3SBX1_9STRA